MSQDLTKANLNMIATSMPTITLSETVTPDTSPLSLDNTNFERNYNGIDWGQLNQYQKPFRILERNASFIYQYRY